MDIDTHNELETKAGIPLDAVVTHGEMMRAFEAFKDANDERLGAIERRAADVAARGEGRAHRCRARRADAPARRARAEVGAAGARRRRARSAARSALRAQGGVRRLCAQRRERAACARSKSKAMSVGSNPDGGYLVPAEIETRDRPAARRRSRRSARSPACARSPATSTRSRS